MFFSRRVHVRPRLLNVARAINEKVGKFAAGYKANWGQAEKVQSWGQDRLCARVYIECLRENGSVIVTDVTPVWMVVSTPNFVMSSSEPYLGKTSSIIIHHNVFIFKDFIGREAGVQN